MTNPIANSIGYRMISDFYSDRKAERSQVLLINHINEGLEILRRINASELEMEAYAVHPIFQADNDLSKSWKLCDLLNPQVVLLTMEYRQVANAFLSDKIRLTQNWYDLGRPSAFSIETLKLSVIPEVNNMLIADKVQNRKDFERYHKGSHVRSVELDYYFKYWLSSLGISPERYLELIEDL